MAITTYKFRGTVSFLMKKPKQWKPEEPPKYSVMFYPEDRAAVRATGVKNKIKEDKEGKFFYSFYNLDPIPVFVEEKVFDGYVGNGSEVELILDVETFVSPKHGASARSKIAAVNVLKLVPYDPPKQEAPVSGAASTPAPGGKMPF